MFCDFFVNLVKLVPFLTFDVCPSVLQQIYDQVVLKSKCDLSDFDVLEVTLFVRFLKSKIRDQIDPLSELL